MVTLVKVVIIIIIMIIIHLDMLNLWMVISEGAVHHHIMIIIHIDMFTPS